jgi:branched-chain amino acid transport system substrate-binding protein
MGRLARILAIAACLLALSSSGCLGEQDGPSRAKGRTLVVYSSLPESGVSAPDARAVAAGERLALREAGGKAAGLSVRLVQLDAASPGGGPWSPDRVSANADRAGDDPRAIAYIGELAYGASAVSVPVTSKARLLQVSPMDTLTSLTRLPAGRPRAGPERYYPTGRRNFVRLVPDDERLAKTLLDHARTGGASRMAVLFDSDVYSRELAAQLLALGRRDGPQPLASEEFRGRGDDIPEVVHRLAEGRPDAVVYAGIAQRGTGRLLVQIDRQLPGVPLYTTSGLLERDPDRPLVPAPSIVRALGAAAPAKRFSSEAVRLSRRLSPDGRPEALLGYEAMRHVLGAIRAGRRDRDRVRRAGMRARQAEDARFALWALRDGRFDFVRLVG